MWGRANMAAVTLQLLMLLGWICIFARSAEAEEQQQQQVDASEQQVLERAVAWLWGQRDRDSGWANDTQRVLLALRLANLSRDQPTQPDLLLQLSAKQMQIEIVLLLWRHREMGSSPVRLARYSLALNSMCLDPRQFFGHDLVGTLLHHEPATDYEFALTALAACNAQAHVRKRQMRRLLDIAHTAQKHNIDTVAMGIMTLRCIVQDHRHRNLQHFVRKPSVSLGQRQQADGGFGDVSSTALALQALDPHDDEPLDGFNRSAAVAWLASRQAPDGSFDQADLTSTAEVVLGLAPTPIPGIRSMDCGQLDGPAAPIAGLSPGEASTGRESSPSVGPSSTTTGPTVGGGKKQQQQQQQQLDYVYTQGPSAYIVGQQEQQLVNVTYTLWVGSDVGEMYNLSLSAPKNETFYEVMVLAAQRSTNFQFSAYEWPNGHYVHTLGGYKEEPMSYHYWLLYRLQAPPDPESPPGNQLVAPGGVDDLTISDGEHYLFWYKKL